MPKLRNGHKAAQDLAHLVEQIEATMLEDVAKMANKYELDNKHLAPATIRNRLAYLKAAVRYAYKKHNYGDRDYTDKMTMPTVNNERQIYAKTPQLESLWAAFEDAEARAVFRLAYYCGVRWRVGMLTRTQDDIERNGKDVWINFGRGKNDTERMKWVHPDAHADLAYIPFKKSNRALYAHFEKAREAIGRPELVAHDLRHSLASNIISKGGTLPDVQGALDHLSVVSSKRYAHLYPERLKKVLENAHSTPKNTRRKIA